MTEAERLHHAYLLIGEPQNTERELERILEYLSFKKEGNPDYYRFGNELFGIDEARTLQKRAEVRAFGERKILVIAPSRFTLEAQNALLKLLEEPAANTHFFILARDKEIFLPTLLSRVETKEVRGEGSKDSVAKEFIKMSMKERMAFAKEFSDSERSLPAFIDALLLELRTSGADLVKLEKVFNIRKFADDRSALPRLILEHLALVV